MTSLILSRTNLKDPCTPPIKCGKDAPYTSNQYKRQVSVCFYWLLSTTILHAVMVVDSRWPPLILRLSGSRICAWVRVIKNIWNQWFRPLVRKWTFWRIIFAIISWFVDIFFLVKAKRKRTHYQVNTTFNSNRLRPITVTQVIYVR